MREGGFEHEVPGTREALARISATALELADIYLLMKKFEEGRVDREAVQKKKDTLIADLYSIKSLTDWLYSLDEDVNPAYLREEISRRSLDEILDKGNRDRGLCHAGSVNMGGRLSRNELINELVQFWHSVDGWRVRYHEALGTDPDDDWGQVEQHEAGGIDDPFVILGLNPKNFHGLSGEAARDVAKKAFRGLAKECHPDKFPNDAQKAEQFKRLRSAFELVIDDAWRASH